MHPTLKNIWSIGRFHIVSIAFWGNLTFGWLFTGKRTWSLAGICALDWYIVNLLNRVVDIPEDRANQIHGTDFVARNRGSLMVVGFGCLALSFVLVHLWMPQLNPWRAAYHFLGLIYNWPLFGKRRLKELYFFKNTASALGFLITVFAYPLSSIHFNFNVFPVGLTAFSLALVVLFFFLFELSYEAIYDLRDVEGDRSCGVKSYAVVHGSKGAGRIIDGLLFSCSALLILGYAFKVLPWRVFIMVVAPVFQYFYYKRAVKRGIKTFDCIFLTWFGAALLATYHAWIALQLPGIGI